MDAYEEKNKRLGNVVSYSPDNDGCVFCDKR